MPKQKTIKGMAKRFRVTRNGKVVSASAGSMHRRVIKTAKQKRRLQGTRALHPTAAKIVKDVMGHNR